MTAVWPQNTSPAPASVPVTGTGVHNANAPLMSSQGITGLRAWYGRIYEELDQALQTERGRFVYRQMMDSDATVGAILNGIEMILRGVTFTLNKADNSLEAERQATYVEQCRNDMEQSWADFVCEAIRGAIGYGWSWFEMQYKRRLGPEPTQPAPTDDDPYPFVPPSAHDDGSIGWWKFGIRGQDALWRWEFSPDFRLIGMWQLPPPDYRLRFIDYEKSVLFRPSQHKESPEGRSFLRNAHRSWTFKQHMETIEGIGIERDLAGLPIFWGPPELLSGNMTPDQAALKSAAQDMVRNIRRDEQEGVIMPLLYDAAGHKLYDLTLLSSAGTRQFNIDVTISRYDQRMAMTMLADFLLLGHESSGSGSYAQVKSRTSLWIMAFNALLTMFCDVINSRAIPKLIRANAWDVKKAPKLGYADIKSLSVQELGQLLQMLNQAGFPVGQDRTLYEYVMAEAAAPTDGAAKVYEYAATLPQPFQNGAASLSGGRDAMTHSGEQIKASREATAQGPRGKDF